jgi:hypothetical protein
MISLFLKVVMMISAAVDLSHSIEPFSPHFSPEQRLEYAGYMVVAGEQYGIDPYLIAGVMWHESDFNNLPTNATNDTGLMQVHWQRLSSNEHWLDGITKKDLLDPRINIFAGVQELAHMREFCASQHHHGHNYWAHLKWGVVVGSRSYDLSILRQYEQLRKRLRSTS